MKKILLIAFLFGMTCIHLQASEKPQCPILKLVCIQELYSRNFEGNIYRFEIKGDKVFPIDPKIIAPMIILDEQAKRYVNDPNVLTRIACRTDLSLIPALHKHNVLNMQQHGPGLLRSTLDYASFSDPFVVIGTAFQKKHYDIREKLASQIARKRMELTEEAQVAYLLQSGVDVNAKIKTFSTTDRKTHCKSAALHGWGSIKSLELLIQAKADVNDSDCFHVTPLMKIADHSKSRMWGSYQISPNEYKKRTKLFLDAGADPDKVDIDGKKAVDYLQDSSLVAWYLNTIPQKNGNTSLHEAASQGHLGHVLTILDYGEDHNINVDVRNHAGSTASDCATGPQAACIKRSMEAYDNPKRMNAFVASKRGKKLASNDVTKIIASYL